MKVYPAGAPRAAAAMFRLLLAYIFDDIERKWPTKSSNNTTKRLTLGAQLKRLEYNAISEDWADWAWKIVNYGNAGAHSNGKGTTAPTLDDIGEVARICRLLIDVIYETPTRLNLQYDRWKQRTQSN